MSDAEQNLDDSTETTQIDYKALYEESLQKLDVVAAKKEQLLKETKAAKAAREQAAAEAQETSKKNGEFEKLWKQAQEDLERERQEKQQLKNGYKNEKIDVVAMRIATSLADGDDADILKTFVKNSLDSLAEDDGSLSEDVIQAVSSEYKNNAKYKSLLRASKASGGGAPGNMRGASETPEKSQKEFDKLSPILKHQFLEKGGKIT